LIGSSLTVPATLTPPRRAPALCRHRPPRELGPRLQGKAKRAALDSRNAVVNLSNRLDRLERETG